MKICFFGSYSKNMRTDILKKGLEKNKVSVKECNIPLKQPNFVPENFLYYLLFMLHSLYLDIVCYSKLSFNYFKASKNCDFVFVPYNWKYDAILAFILSRINKKKLVFDPFVLHYETAVEDRQAVSKNSFTASYLKFLDNISCKLVDLVLADTIQHAEYISEKTNTSLKKFSIVPVGVDEEIFLPKNSKEKEFKVLYYGTYIPLQGIEFVVEAAKLLEKEGIKFKIIGKGQTTNYCLELARVLGVKNIEFVSKNIPLENLPEEIASSSICLGGHFGKTEKANIVVSTKAFQMLAMKKPVILGNTEANNSFFSHRKEAFFCEIGNSKSLAKAILELKKSPALRRNLSNNAFKKSREEFFSKKIGLKFLNALNSFNQSII